MNDRLNEWMDYSFFYLDVNQIKLFICFRINTKLPLLDLCQPIGSACKLFFQLLLEFIAWLQHGCDN